MSINLVFLAAFTAFDIVSDKLFESWPRVLV